MGAIKSLIGLGILILMFLSAFWVYDQIKYSWKVEKDLNNNDATCYFDRGIFNLPLARVCAYNKTLMLQREQLNLNISNPLK